MKTGLWDINGKTKAIAIVLLFVILIDLSYISAVTGSIGNARMILRVNAGDTIDRTVLVQNINNNSVDVSIFPSGDLEKDIKIKDTNFSLAPGEKKDVEFTIKINKEGTFDNKINIQFYSPSEKQGIGLSSNIVIIAGNGIDNENIINNTDLNGSDNVSNISKVNNIIPSITGNTAKFNPVVIAFSVTGIVLFVFFVLLISYFYKNKESQLRKSRGDSLSLQMGTNKNNSSKLCGTKPIWSNKKDNYEEVLVKSEETKSSEITKPKKERVHR